jgi:prefoldin alpha subunit
MDEEEMQKKYIEYQVLTQKINQLQQQMQAVENNLTEIQGAIQNLDDFSKVGDNTEILVPVNNGMFAKATIKKENRFLVNVGASVVVDKSAEDAKRLIGKQEREMMELKAKMMENLVMLSAKSSELEKELSSVVPKE